MLEFTFDVDTDPLQGFCELAGLIEPGAVECVAFQANTVAFELGLSGDEFLWASPSKISVVVAAIFAWGMLVICDS